MSWRLCVWVSISLLLHVGVAGATYGVLRAAVPTALFVDLTQVPAESPVVPDPPARRDIGPSRKVSRPASTAARDRSPASPPAPTAERTPAPAPSPPLAAAPPAAPAASPPPMSPPPAAPAPAAAPPPPVTALDLAPSSASPAAVEAEPRASATGSSDSAPTSTPAAGASSPAPGDRAAAGEPAAAPRGGVGDSARTGLAPGPREGSEVALAVPGAGRGAGDGAEYAAYYGLLRRRVLDAVRYPPVARRRGLSGTVQIELDIQPTGAISRVVVVASSSHRVLDDAAVEAVQQLGRLPFPEHLRPRLLRVRLPVVFELQ